MHKIIQLIVTLVGRIIVRVLPNRTISRISRSTNPFVLWTRSLGKHKIFRAGKISIVVPIYNVEKYLEKCLLSIQAQTYPNFEAILINDGSPDGSVAIAEKFVKTDGRFKLVNQSNKGLGAARNAGIDLARGDFITFLDSDDRIDRNAFYKMVSSLKASGSDFVIGGVVREFENGKTRKDGWAQNVHKADLKNIRLDDLPEATKDVFAWNKLFKKEFFDSVVGKFPENILYEDQMPTARAMSMSSSFDILKDTTYFWLVREDYSSITQNKLRMKDLKDRVFVINEVQEIYRENASPEVYEYWLIKTLGFDLGIYYELGPRGKDEYWEKLVKIVNQLLKDITEEAFSEIKIKERIPILLVKSDAKAELINYYAMEQTYKSGVPTLDKTSHGKPILDTAKLGIEEVIPSPLVHSEEEFSIRTKVFSARWKSREVLEVFSYVFLPTLNEPIKNLQILGIARNETKNLKYTWVSSDNISNLVIPRDSYTIYNETFLKFELNIKDFDLEDEDEIVIRAVLETSKEKSISAPFSNFYKDGIFHEEFSNGKNSDGFIIKTDRKKGLYIRKATFPLWLKTLLSDESQNSLKITIFSEHLNLERRTIRFFSEALNEELAPISCREVQDDTFELGFVFDKKIEEYHKTFYRFSWALQYKDNKNTWKFVQRGYQDEEFFSSRYLGMKVQNTPTGTLRLAHQVDDYEINDVYLDSEENILINLSINSGDPENCTFVLTDQKNNIFLETEVVDATNYPRLTIKFLMESHTKQEIFSIIQKNSWLNLRLKYEDGIVDLSPRIPFDRSQSKEMPVILTGKNYSLRVGRKGRDNEAYFYVTKLIEEKYINAHNNNFLTNLLITESQQQGIMEKVALASSFNGSNTFDSVRPVVEELKSKNIIEKVYWAASDLSINVPDGDEVVLIDTPAYMRILHRAQYLINNNNFPHYFRKQRGQFYCQTWHGTPLKKIANDVPSTSLSYSYRKLMEREVESWDILLGQSEEAALNLKRAFDYQGEVLASGYPKNDILYSARNELELKNTIRANLGIPIDQKVILYAPTWRDNIKTRSGGYKRVDFLDPEKLIHELGDHTTVLMRGHFNTSKDAYESLNANIIDVTKHQDLNELILCSDALITDYSSIMFDYVVTEKPMYFFVPDLHSYLNEVRGLYYNYEEIIPNVPMTSLEDLVEQIRSTDERAIVAKQEKFRLRFAPYDDGKASYRVSRKILDQCSR